MAFVVYILYFMGIFTAVTAFIGLVIAYVNKNHATHWVASHYRFQIYTFWIGLLWLIVGSILTFVFIGWLVLLIWIIWLIIRLVIAMRYFGLGKAIPDPTTWGLP